VVTSWV